jgi:hypothetical protein
MHSSLVAVTCCRSTPATAAASATATTAGERRRASQHTPSGSIGSTLPTGTSSIVIHGKLSVFGAFLHPFPLNFLLRSDSNPCLDPSQLLQQRIFIFGNCYEGSFFIIIDFCITISRSQIILPGLVRNTGKKRG